MEKMKAKELRKASWNALKGRYGAALLAALIAGIFGTTYIGIGSTSMKSGGTGAAVSPTLPDLPDWAMWTIIGGLVAIFIIAIIMAILSASVNIGYSLFNIKLMNGEKPEAGVCFSRMKHIRKAFGLSLLIAIKILLWSLLFIIPGIIASYRYAMASYVMAEDPEISITGAINKSKEIMKGEKWNLFCMQISFIWWGLLASIVPVIGLFLLTPYTSAADAAFYLNRTGRLNK